MKKALFLFIAAFTALALLSGCALTGNTSESAEKPGSVSGAKTAASDPTIPRTDPVTGPVTGTAAATEPLTDTEPVVDPFDDVKEITVADQLAYSKKVVTADYAKEMGMDFGDMEHVVTIPALSGTDSENAIAFNKKILDKYSGIVELLKSGGEEGSIFNITYSAHVNGESVAILMTESYGVQIGGVSTVYSFFYYDLHTDRELSFEEYLANFGYDRASLAETLGGSEEYAEYAESVRQSDESVGELPLTGDDLLGCCFDTESGTVFVISTNYFMDDSFLITTGVFCGEISR